MSQQQRAGRGRGVRRAIRAGALAAAVLLAVPQAPAAAGPDTGWSVTRGPDGTVLSWRAPADVPALRFGDARLEVRAGDRLLGSPRVTDGGRRVELRLPAGTQPVDPDALRLVASGRRLDRPLAATPVRPSRATAAVAPTLPLLAADPGRPGPHAVSTGRYRSAPLALPGLPVPVEVEGLVVAPVGTTGPRPLVVLLHGRHTTCYRGGPTGESSGDWPCRAGWRPVPSADGYQQTQRLLASQGYLTVSVSANGINGQDDRLDDRLDDAGESARAQLLARHLRLWTGWSGTARAGAPAAVRAVPPADVGRVLLVGHSRGGMGANRASLDAVTGSVPWTIRGQVLIAPTAFGQNPAPGVPTEVLLPTCDGDVSDLQGQTLVDGARDYVSADRVRDTALRSSVLVVGANHNHFNTEWTRGQAAAPSWDDWEGAGDPVCGSRAAQRLTPAEQQSVGATYVAAAARVFVARDAAAEPLLDGTPVRAASAGRALVRAHALGGRRTPVLVPEPGVRTASRGTTRTAVCRQLDDGTPRACTPRGIYGRAPHHVPLVGLAEEPSRSSVSVAWRTPRGSASVALPRPVSLRGARALELRVAVPPRSAQARFAVRLVDTAGRTAVLPGRSTALEGLPGGEQSGKYWAQPVRLPLPASGVDLGAVARLEVVPRSGTGHLEVLDAWGWSPGTPASSVRLPRLDVVTARVPEGRTRHPVTLPVRVTDTPSAQRAWVAEFDPETGLASSSTRTVAPGSGGFDLSFQVEGDEVDSPDRVAALVFVKPLGGLVAGDWTGSLTVLDDDAPQP